MGLAFHVFFKVHVMLPRPDNYIKSSHSSFERKKVFFRKIVSHLNLELIFRMWKLLDLVLTTQQKNLNKLSILEVPQLISILFFWMI